MLYRNKSSQKRYLLNVKIPVPSSERNETGQIGSTASYPWQESRARSAPELSLNPSGIRSNFTFTTSFSKTASLWVWKRLVQQQQVCRRSGLAEPRGRSFRSPCVDGLRLYPTLSQVADPKRRSKKNPQLVRVLRSGRRYRLSPLYSSNSETLRRISLMHSNSGDPPSTVVPK